MRFYGYPIRYFSRGKNSDLKFILSRMSVIPERLKLEVSDKYESFRPELGGENRKKANYWLHDEALKYKSNPQPSERQKVSEKIESRPPEKREIERKLKVDTSAPEKKKGFLDGLLDDVDAKCRRRS